jgi:hypothetical protein
VAGKTGKQNRKGKKFFGMWVNDDTASAFKGIAKQHFPTQDDALKYFVDNFETFRKYVPTKNKPVIY